MPSRVERNQYGFTLLEALISLSIFSVVFVSLLSMYTPTREIYARGERTAELQQNGRLAMSEMARQIRLAGYFPENFNGAASPPLEAAIRLATDTALAVYGDMDNTGQSNVFMLCFDADAGAVRRTRAATDEIGAYTCNAGEVLAENVAELRFTYFDADSNPIPDPPAAPYALDDQTAGSIPGLDDTAERETVRNVAVTLTLESQLPRQTVQRFTLRSDVWIRNLD